MISASVVQAPVFYGHAQMVNFEALRPLAAEEARDAFAQGEDIVLSEERIPDSGRGCFGYAASFCWLRA